MLVNDITVFYNDGTTDDFKQGYFSTDGNYLIAWLVIPEDAPEVYYIPLHRIKVVQERLKKELKTHGKERRRRKKHI